LQVGDLSVIHPGASTFRRAAANTAGTAAAHTSSSVYLSIVQSIWCGIR
jgi:hypothetical protein